jgi:alpha-glucosidase
MSAQNSCCHPSLHRTALWLLVPILVTRLHSVPAVAAENWSVASPGGQVNVAIRFAKGQGDQGSRLVYAVESGRPNSRSVVVPDSPLGLKLRGADLVDGLRFDSAQPPTVVEDAYTMPHGKRHSCRNRANQISLTFRNGDGLKFELQLRAYDDGVAFRYRLPVGPAGTQTLESEETGFALPSDAKIWCAPSDKAGTYSPGYETYYENETPVGVASPLGFGWSFPLLFRTADSRHWGLITEANLDATFCGSRLCNTPQNGLYTVALPNPAEGNGQGPVAPSSSLPWGMPWRVIILGDSLATIVESTLVTDVCAPSRVRDTSWIRPGRVAWSWWSDNPSPTDAAKQRSFIDLAAEMGWDYVLVDANWTIMENGNIREVLNYAKDKGVGVLLWYNSGGPHNVVTEKPRDCFTYAPVRRFELEMLKRWGVKGVKVDFFQSDKQDVIGVYEGIMRDAAEHQIMVNFHGCTLPRGWERTYPHLMSMEAVRGEECYIFDSHYPDRAPTQNTILPFTRNAVGPMDYTPVGFSNNRYPHKTTSAHELALAVLFESGWLHFADGVAAYRALPPEPKQFLKDVPVAWDDTRFIDGYPGQFVVLARKKGDTWYLAGVNGENRLRQITAKPGPWLAQGRYTVSTICDGADSRTFESSTRPFDATQGLPLRMLPFGGFVAVIRPEK